MGAVHAGYHRYREGLLESGVRLYELKPDAIRETRAKGDKGGFGGSRASLHAKTFFFDRRAVFIGSLNLDPRSIQLAVMRHQAGRQFRIHAYAIARVAGSLPVTCGDDAGPDVA